MKLLNCGIKLFKIQFFILIQNFQIKTFRVKRQANEDEIDFTDRAYQNQLPMHARSTASKAVKNNLRITEIMADQNLILKAQKVTFHETLLYKFYIIKSD